MKDYIEREAAYEVLSEYYHHSTEIQHRALRDALSRVPAADVKPVVRGEWKPNPRNPYWLVCTVCGYGKPEKTVYNFCPNCGADMRKANDEKA